MSLIDCDIRQCAIAKRAGLRYGPEQIYDSLSKDLEEVIDANLVNKNTACILRNIRANWDVS